MTESYLLKKLGIKSSMLITLINAPESFKLLLVDIPEENMAIKIKQHKLVDYVHAFYHNKKELLRDIYFLKQHLQKNGMLWISWPKGSSGADTDLNREIIREVVLGEGLVDVKVCSINETWSALKFVFRIKDR